MVALVAPVLLVVAQPDLGTSILIALGGITVSWLAGVRVKFFAYASILFISLTANSHCIFSNLIRKQEF